MSDLVAVRVTHRVARTVYVDAPTDAAAAVARDPENWIDANHIDEDLAPAGVRVLYVGAPAAGPEA